MNFLIIFLSFSLAVSANSESLRLSLTTEEFNSERDQFIMYHEKITKLAEEYRERGYYSIEKWLKNYLDDEKFLDVVFEISVKKHRCIAAKFYKDYFAKNRYLSFVHRPFQLNRLIKTTLLMTAGTMLAKNYKVDNAEKMIDKLNDILELEGTVGENFEAVSEELDNLYADMIDMVIRVPDDKGVPSSILQIEKFHETVDSFIKQNPLLSFIEQLEESYDPLKRNDEKILRMETIDSVEEMDFFLQLIQQHNLLIGIVMEILQINGYTCTEWECLTLEENLVEKHYNCDPVIENFVRQHFEL